jgi:hypothetical protein
MSMIINLPQRLIELTDSGIQLLFDNDDRFFYLQVIALVAKRMKEKGESENSRVFVSLSEFEDQAWSLSKQKPRAFKSKKSLRVNLYQTWRSRFNPKEGKLIYRVEWPENMPEINRDPLRLKEIFKIEPGKGPETAAYGVDHKPEEIIIIWKEDQSEYATCEGLTDEDRADRLLERVDFLVCPWAHRDQVMLSQKAVRSFLYRESLWRVDNKGRLIATLLDCANAFVESLGVVGISGSVVMPSWLEILEADPLWELLVTAGAETHWVTNKSEIPNPMKMVERCLDLGDLPGLAWIFHRAYLASVVAVKRDAFFQTLQRENSNVRKLLYAKWTRNSVNPKGVESNPKGYFHAQQKIHSAFLPFFE